MITQDIQTLSPGALVELFEIDATTIGGDVVRFHNGVNALGNDVVWQGNTYLRFPIEASGFQYTGKGQLPRPKLTLANVTGLLGALVRVYQDLIGAKLTRRRTLLKYLDAANFADGNPSADPTAAFPDEVYFIDRKATENKLLVEFELSAAFDVAGVTLPRRYVVQNVCPWKYRSAECSYSGTNYFDQNDHPVATLELDICGKRLSSCKCRFGQYSALPFGGFPGAGLFR